MLQIVIRTCDRHSLQSTRIVHKTECILRCLNSLIKNIQETSVETRLHIIDDNSSIQFRTKLLDMISDLPFVSVDLLPERCQTGLSAKKKSRYSLQVALEYIYSLSNEDLIYLVEDDYLHYPGALTQLVKDWNELNTIASFDVGIFPQDFQQLHYHKFFPFNNTYIKPSVTLIINERYYKTTWYTQESFFVQAKTFKKYKSQFDSLLTIGDNEGNWEGNTISKIWEHDEFKMFMPLKSFVIHLSTPLDIPFYVSKEEVLELWEQNKTFWSSVQDSQVQL